MISPEGCTRSHPGAAPPDYAHARSHLPGGQYLPMHDVQPFRLTLLVAMATEGVAPGYSRYSPTGCYGPCSCLSLHPILAACGHTELCPYRWLLVSSVTSQSLLRAKHGV